MPGQVKLWWSRRSTDDQKSILKKLKDQLDVKGDVRQLISFDLTDVNKPLAALSIGDLDSANETSVLVG